MTALYAFTYTPVDVQVMVDALIDAYTSPCALARVVGVRHNTVYGWQRGVVPQHRHYDRIAELYGHLTAWDKA